MRSWSLKPPSTRTLVAGGVALLAIVAVVIALSAGGSSSSHHLKTVGREPRGTGPCATSPAPASDARNQVVVALNRYACAFTNQSLNALTDLLTSDVQRHGLRNGGCIVTHGRLQARQVYRETFDIAVATLYRLFDVKPKNPYRPLSARS